jgi:D-alanyl-D-alanine carboxypeptidase
VHAAAGGPVNLRAVIVGGAIVCAVAPLESQELAWMAGCWERRTATGVGREEWHATAQGLDGGSATFRGDTLIAWEFLRIAAADGRVAYHAAPNGQSAHAFPLVAVSADSAHFADPAHDFPQRIVYRRIGADSLVAQVAGQNAGQQQGFALRFARVACDPARDLTAAVALRDTLSHLLDSVRALGRAPGLSAAVALPDGRTITLVSGLADSSGMVPLTPAHKLLAGSVGKTFFAALALNLVAEGQLDLDAKISRWLGAEPWFARLPNGADITVRQLMNHTSGLVRYEFDPEFTRDLGADPLRDWQVAEQLSYVLGDAPPFAAGAGWEYSDTNYLVLALIIEQIIGGPAYDAIRTRFLVPLRLRGTVPSVSTRIAGLANGYGATPDPLGMSGPMMVNGALKMNPKFEWAGGGYASTPEDLARWTQAWHDGRVIPAAVLAEAHHGVAARGLGGTARYGLGVIVRDSPRGVTYGHSGFFPGYLTEVRYYPASKVAVAVQANTSDGRAIGRGLAAIAHLLADRAMGPADR